MLCGCGKESSLEEALMKQADGDIQTISTDSQLDYVCVHICGEVMEPGVYTIKAESRVADVLTCAGGFTAEASTTSINLAKKVEDGMQVIIPSVSQVLEETLSKAEEGMVNINTATEAELATLPGIGSSRARDIISYRESNGGFSTIEDIMKVSGIKEATFVKIQALIIVGNMER